MGKRVLLPAASLGSSINSGWHQSAETGEIPIHAVESQFPNRGRRIAPAMGFGLYPIARAIFREYFHLMNNKKHFFKPKQAGFVLGAVLLAALTEGVNNADAQPVSITLNPPVVVAPAVVSENYVYYPNYGVYYNSRRHQYIYLKGDAWVTQPAPYGVSAAVLMASPSVDMDFHDSPEKHHAEMLKKYPHDWKPSGAQQDQKDNRQDAAPDHDKK
jgi:hypothetical protein